MALVVVHHAWPWLLPGGGTAGVGLFFVLSGFLISTLLLEEHGAQGRLSYRAFYVRRARRLVPALALLLVAYLAWIVLAEEGGRGEELRTVGVTALYVGDIWSFVLHRPLSLGLSHTWSLAIEEHFYLLWPLALSYLVARARRPSLAAVLALAVVGGIALRGVFAAAGLTLGNSVLWLDALPIGCLLATLFIAGRLRRWLAAPLTGAVAAGALLAVAWRTDFEAAADSVLGQPVIAVASAGLVIAALDGPLARVLAGSGLRALGRISYALYLWSWPAILVAHRAMDGAGAAPVGVLGGVGLAVGSTVLVEERFRRRRPGAATRPSSTLLHP